MARRRQREPRRDFGIDPPPIGGRFKPLLDAEIHRIVDTALTILETIGMAGLPADLAAKLMTRGASRISGRAARRCKCLIRAPGHMQTPSSMISTV